MLPLGEFTYIANFRCSRLGEDRRRAAAANSLPDVTRDKMSHLTSLLFLIYYFDVLSSDPGCIDRTQPLSNRAHKGHRCHTRKISSRPEPTRRTGLSTVPRGTADVVSRNTSSAPRNLPRATAGRRAPGACVAERGPRAVYGTLTVFLQPWQTLDIFRTLVYHSRRFLTGAISHYVIVTV